MFHKKSLFIKIIHILIIVSMCFPYVSYAEEAIIDTNTNTTDVTTDQSVITSEASNNSVDIGDDKQNSDKELLDKAINKEDKDIVKNNDDIKDKKDKGNSAGPITQSLLSGGPSGIDVGEAYTALNLGTRKHSYTPAELKENYGVDKATGAFHYTLPFPLPENISGISPEVKLSYNSQSNDDFSIIAHGWDLTMPRITLKNIYGTDKMYTNYGDCSYFNLTLPNDSVEFKESPLATGCVGTGGYEYVNNFDVVGSNNHNYRIVFNYQAGTTNKGTFDVIDDQGTVYHFGTNNKRVDVTGVYMNAVNQTQPYDGAYEWLLDQVVDTHGNTITYNYLIEDGVAYPKNIVYGGSSKYEVRFEPFNTGVTTANLRSDKRENYLAGYRRYIKYKLDRISYAYDNTVQYYWNLGYTSAASGTQRSVLNSVSPYMKNGGSFTYLPQQTFTYQAGKMGYDRPGTYSYTQEGAPQTVTYANNSRPARFLDINGDAYPDVIYAHGSANNSPFPWMNNNTISTRKSIYINNGNWTPTTIWPSSPTNGFTDVTPVSFPSSIPEFSVQSYSGGQYDFHTYSGFEFMDLDGDSVPERSIGAGTDRINWGNYTLTGSTTVLPNIFSFADNGTSSGTETIDLNGDGLLDFIHNLYHLGFSSNQEGYAINGGNLTWGSFTGGQSTNMLWKQTYYNTATKATSFFRETSTRFVDVNADGLDDAIVATDEGNKPFKQVFLNNGFRFVPSNWVWPGPLFFSSSSNLSQPVVFVDWNADGYPDIATNTGFYLNNTVNGWTYQGDDYGAYNFLQKIAYTGSKNIFTGNEYVDINADGIVDVIPGMGDQPSSEYLHTPAYINRMPAYIHAYAIPEIMTSVDNNKGSIITLNYKPSSQYREGTQLANPNLSRVIQTVETMTVTNNAGGAVTTTYKYNNGVMYNQEAIPGSGVPHRSEFGGFGKVTETRADNTKSITYFHQANGVTGDEQVDDFSLMRAPYKIESYNADGTLVERLYTKHSVLSLPQSEKKSVTDYEINSRDSIATAVGYTYDTTYGTVTQKREYGIVQYDSTTGLFTDTGLDQRITNITYAVNTGLNLIPFVASLQLLNQSNQLVTRSEYYYDGLSLGSISKGDRTEVREYKTPLNTYKTTQYQYDTYGNITKIIAPNGGVTDLSYDAVLKFLPTQLIIRGATASDDLMTTYTWDGASGHPLLITQPTGAKTSYTYDSIGRALTRSVSQPSDPNTLIQTHSYIYTASGPTNIETRLYTNSGNPTIYTSSFVYYDGLGRLIETKEQHSSNQYITVDTHYDARGNASYVSHPYFDSVASFSQPNWWSIREATQTVFDGANRPKTITTQTGTTQYSYNGLTTTITNPRGKQKVTTTDVFSNLVSVIETNNAQQYTTTYIYDIRDQLIGITDAEGNVRAFGYDVHGNRVSATDLKRAGDTDRTWVYGYDVSNNLIQTTDPIGNVITYSYDILNRITSETRNSVAYATYQYGTSGNSKGKLTSITTPDIGIAYIYDTHGNIITENKTIGTTLYTTTNTYDHLDRLITTTIPDTSVTSLTYTYDQYNRLSGMSKNGSAIVTAVSYAPTMQIASITYANNDIETYTRSAGTDYRLTRKLTMNGATKLQDINYYYDANSNITRVNNVATGALNKNAVYTYDDLDRLINEALTVGASTINTAYTYSPTGNILTKGALTFGYTDHHPQALTTVSIGGTLQKTLAYDLNGNMVSVTCDPLAVGCTNSTYTYNSSNRMTGATVGATVLSYTYDHAGQRIKSITPTKSTTQITPSYDIDSLGVENVYMKFNDLTVAQYKKVAGTPAITTLSYTHTDHLGGSSVMTNTSGTVQVSRDYYPYGETRVDIVTDPNYDTKYQFTGQEKDMDSGLQYFHERYYNSEVGRFVSIDRLERLLGDRSFEKQAGYKLTLYLSNPQKLNGFAYALNNPIRFIDSSGADEDETVQIIVRSPSSSSGIDFGHVFVRIGDKAYEVYGESPSNIFGTRMIVGVNDKPSIDPTIDYSVLAESQNEMYSDSEFHVYTIQMSEEEKKVFEQYFRDLDNPQNSEKEKYNLFTNNCTTTINDAFDAAGVPEVSSSAITPSGYDRSLYQSFESQMQSTPDMRITNAETQSKLKTK